MTRPMRILAIAMTPGERDLLLRALRAYRTDELRAKANVLHLLAHAPDVDALVELREVEAPA